METKAKIVYTKSAQERLNRLNKDIEQRVTDYIKMRKFVPGDDFIEITASDIEDVWKRITIIPPQKSQFRQLILFIYAVMGIVLTLFGLFYSNFTTLIQDEPNRLMVITIGLTLSMFSVLFSFYLNAKQKKEKELLQAENEKNKISEIYKSIYSQVPIRDEDASTQYNDLKGTAALDFHGSLSELWDYFKEFKIDLEKYDPIGIDVYFGEGDFFYLSFLATDKEQMEEYKKQNQGKLPVLSISVEETKENFFKKFKRFNVSLSRKGLEKNFNITREVSLDELNQ